MAGEIRRAELTWDGVSAAEGLERELIMSRMRGEIILKELARVRLLEEEVRRELEIGRALAMRKHHNGLVSSFGVVAPKASDDRLVSSHIGKEMAIETVDADRRNRVDLFGDQMLVEKRSPINALQVFGGRKVEERSPTNAPQIDHGTNSAVLTFSANAEQSAAVVGGIKRRASELPGVGRKKAGGPAEHDWSCAICQVSVGSRETMNEHLKGRRHKAKAQMMGIIKNIGLSISAKGAARPSAVAKDAVLKEQKAAGLWCALCKVECNSDDALTSHLGGKKHRTTLGKSRSARARKCRAVKLEVKRRRNLQALMKEQVSRRRL